MENKIKNACDQARRKAERIFGINAAAASPRVLKTLGFEQLEERLAMNAGLFSAGMAEAVEDGMMDNAQDSGMNVIEGTDRNDNINGSAGDDLIFGGDGSDHLRGKDGDDGILGGDGDDRIDGGKGNDEILGGDGDDDIKGGDGDDLIGGGAGDDSIDGGSGNDTAYYANDIEDYEITENKDGSLTIRDLKGDEGIDNVKNVESFNFNGEELSLEQILKQNDEEVKEDLSDSKEAVSNVIPDADAGDDQLVLEGSTVTLNATGSHDADNDDLTYKWVQTSGPDVELIDADSANPSFVAPETGDISEITFEVHVSDGESTDIDVVEVEVLDTEVHQVRSMTQSDLRYIDPEQVQYLSVEQIEGITNYNYFTAMSADARAELSEEQVQALDGSQVHLGYLTAEQREFLTEEQVQDLPQSMFRYLPADQVEHLTVEQIEGITNYNYFTAMSADARAELSEEQVQALDGSQVHLGYLTAEQREFLTEEQVQDLPQSMFRYLPADQVEHLTVEQIEGITNYNYFTAMSADARAELSEEQVQALDGSQVHLGYLTAEQREFLTEEQVQDLPQSMFRYLPADQVEHLTVEQIESITNYNYFTAMSADARAELSEEQVHALDGSQVHLGYLTAEQREFLTEEQVQDLPQSMFRYLPADQVEHLTVEQIESITNYNYFTAMSADARAALSEEQVQALDGSQVHLGYLTAEQREYLTEEQVQDLPSSMFRYLPADQVQHLTVDQLSNMSSVSHYTSMSVEARNALSFEQIEALPVSGTIQIEGTDENDNLNGNQYSNIVKGLDGDDQISAKGGKDIIDGGAGNDTIDGGDEDDKIFGGTGDDTLIGGKGNDLLDGGEGNDVARYSGNRDEYDIVFNEDGSVTVSHVSGDNGVDTLTDVESLQFDDMEFALVDLNDAPEGNTDHYTTMEDQPIEFNPLTNDIDLDGDLLSVVKYSQPEHGKLEVAPDGTFTYIPDSNYHGTDSFEYVVTDGNDAFAKATVNLTIDSVIDEPILIVSDVEGMEDTPIQLSIDVKTPDLDKNEVAVVEISKIPSGAILTDGEHVFEATGHNHSVDVSEWNLEKLTIQPPENSHADFELEVTSFARLAEANNTGLINLSEASFDSYAGADQDRIGDAELSEDGNVVTFSGNLWKSIDYPYEVTEDTILEFQFKSDSVPELAGIGFDNDSGMSLENIFKLYGTQDHNSTVNDFNHYDGSGDWVTYRIPVGEYFTGEFGKLVFMNDDDAAPYGNSSYSNIRLYENGDITSGLVTENISVTIQSDFVGAHLEVDDIKGIEDEDIPLPIEISLHDESDSQIVKTVIENLPEGVKLTDGTHEFTSSSGETTADVTSWNLEQLTLKSAENSDQDFDLKITTTAKEIIPAIDLSQNSFDSYAGADQDRIGDAELSEDGNAVTFSGNLWKSIDYPYEVTEDTILEFQFKSDSVPELAGIGFDNDSGMSLENIFKLYGTQDHNSTVNDFNHYDGSGEWVTYRIPVGEYFTGEFGKLVFMNDDDAAPYGNSSYSNIRLYDESDSEEITTSASIHVEIAAKADAVDLEISDAKGLEDSAIGLKINANLIDTDGSEKMTLEIENIPSGATLTDGKQEFTATDKISSVDVSEWDLGNLFVIPVENDHNDFTLLVKATSLEAENADEAVTLEKLQVYVESVNDGPVATEDFVKVTEDQPVVINALANDTDLDGDQLSIGKFSQPSHGSVELNKDGTFTYTPDENFHGKDQFQYVIADGQGGFSESTVYLNVESVNDGPVAEGDEFKTEQGQPIVLENFLSNDFDLEGDQLSVAEFTQPANGRITLNQDGTFTYTPNKSFYGVDTFTYTVSDGQGGFSTATISIEVEQFIYQVDEQAEELGKKPVGFEIAGKNEIPGQPEKEDRDYQLSSRDVDEEDDPRRKAVQRDMEEFDKSDPGEKGSDQEYYDERDHSIYVDNRFFHNKTGEEKLSPEDALDLAFSRLTNLDRGEDRENDYLNSLDSSSVSNAIDLALTMGIALNPIDTTPLGEMDISKTTIGALSVRLGILQVDDVHRILQVQNVKGGQFGQIAEELGLLTPVQVESLLEVQKLTRHHIYEEYMGVDESDLRTDLV